MRLFNGYFTLIISAFKFRDVKFCLKIQQIWIFKTDLWSTNTVFIKLNFVKKVDELNLTETNETSFLRFLIKFLCR